MIHAQWDSSVLIAFWIAGILLLAGFVAIIVGLAGMFRSDGYFFAGSFIAGCCSALLGLVIGLVAWLPGSQYDRFVPYSGTVDHVTSRFIGDNSSTTQIFGITFKNGDVRKCNDTRCSAISKGDRVTLLCEREFQFNQPNEGWDCNFVSREAK